MAGNEKEDVIQGPGFIIKDRRKFTEEGDRKEKTPEARVQKPESKKEESGGPSVGQKETRDEKSSQQQAQDVPLPEVNFANFVFSLIHSAMLALGSLPDPATGKTEKHLPMAKHIIDTIAMLQQKTQGNLTEEERRLIDDSLYDLRLYYVKEKDKLAGA